MADEGKLTLPRSLNLNTVVLLVSVGASFWAQWAIFKERSDNQTLQISELNTHVNSTDEHLTALKDDFIESRAQLRDLIENLQRQHAALSPVTPIEKGLPR
jgi:hypothetical protein